MKKLRLATIWLDGCSGCHMSFLDMDERLITLADKVDIVFSPLVDIKEFPENVDIALVEGAISTVEDEEKIHKIRSRAHILVAFGDCAVTANVPSMRNPFGVKNVLEGVYLQKDALNAQIPVQMVPALLERAKPLHHVVHVDLFVPGCPPSANTIFYMLNELIEGREVDLSNLSRFGA